MITIETYCPICHTTHEVEVPFEAFCEWQSGACVQDAFPMLSANDREMLISGICPDCWDSMFPSEDGEDDEFEPDYEDEILEDENLEMGFDHYMGCYSDDC